MPVLLDVLLFVLLAGLPWLLSGALAVVAAIVGMGLWLALVRPTWRGLLLPALTGMLLLDVVVVVVLAGRG